MRELFECDTFSEMENFFVRELLEAPPEASRQNITLEETGHGVGCSVGKVAL